MSALPLPPGDGGAEGERRRDEALRWLRAYRAVLVRRVQRALLSLLLAGDSVTADDVRDVVPIPPGIRPVLVGAAVAGLADLHLIRQTGYALSRRPEAHRRPVGIWTLDDYAGALAWLAAYPELPDPPAGPDTLPLYPDR